MGSRTLNWNTVKQQELSKNKKSLYVQYGKFGRCMKSVSKGKRCANPIRQQGKIMCDKHLKEDVLLQ